MVGDFFPAAAELLDHPIVRGRSPLLVHGVPRRERFPRVRFWHAWVECKFGGRWYCIDASNGRFTFLERNAYLERGMLHLSEARKLVTGYPLYVRYTEETARAEMLRHEHFGPWVEDPDGWT